MIRYMLPFLLGILSFNANAQLVVTTNGNLTFDLGPTTTAGSNFSVTHTESGTFTDVFEFSLSNPGTEFGDLGMYEGVTPISFNLYSSSGNLIVESDFQFYYSGEMYWQLLGQLGAGSYYFKIVGPAAGGVADPYISSTYVFTDLVTLVTPVPEPSTYALMLMGMLGIGYVLRRRARKTTAEPSFCVA